MALPQGLYIKDVAETIDYIASVVLLDWIDSQPSLEAVDAMASRLHRSAATLEMTIAAIEKLRAERHAA